MNIFEFLNKKRLLFLFPHPDDESYSCFGLLQRILQNRQDIFLEFLTTGAPDKAAYAPPFSDQFDYDEYVFLRATEQSHAMESLGLSDAYAVENFGSRTVGENIFDIYNIVQKRIQEFAPDIIFSCPYEGAHPDHDICSYIASVAQQKNNHISIIEYSGYHLYRGQFRSSTFLSKRGSYFLPVKLTNNELLAKKHYMEQYVSQKPILEKFTIDQEVFRIQPSYDYRRAPTKNPYYSSWPSNITPHQVTSQIRKAMKLFS